MLFVIWDKNYEERLLVIHMQGPVWTVMTHVHIVQLYKVMIEKITVCKRQRKMEQKSLDDSALPHLDVQEHHMQI